MHIADFGAIDGPLCLAGGIASNLHALGAFRQAAHHRPVILTGDIAAYGASPA